MMEKIDRAYLYGKQVLKNKLEEWKEEERGSSEMVTVVILVVIVLGIAITFKGQLELLMNKVVEKLKVFTGK